MKHLILFIIFCTCAQGQNNENTINVRLLALNNAVDLPERFLSTKEGYVKIAFSNRQATQTIKAYTAGLLPLFKKAIDPNSEAEYVVAEQVKFSPKSRSILLLCWKSREGGLRYYSVNDNILNANYNSWFMVNASPKVVAFRIGHDAKPVILKPNSIKNHQVNAAKDKGVPVMGRAKFKGKAKTFYSTYWKIRDKERSIIIFTEVGNKIKVVRVGDPLVKAKDDTPQTVR